MIICMSYSCFPDFVTISFMHKFEFEDIIRPINIGNFLTPKDKLAAISEVDCTIGMLISYELRIFSNNVSDVA